MRRTSVFTVAVVALFAAQVVHALETTRARIIDHLVFEGVKSFDVKELRDTLSRDVDVVAAERPHVAPEFFLKAVERTLTLGYQHSGFRDVRVKASYEQDSNRTVVRIQEGHRHVCGEVKIVGCQRIKPDVIVACITEAVDTDEILWPVGQSVPYDEVTRGAIRDRLRQTFCAAGFFKTEFDIDINVEGDNKRAALLVNVRDEGPQARIGEITVEGANRDGPAEVLRFLSLDRGQPFDSLLPTRIEEKLDQSGRFVISEVLANPDPKNSDKEHDLFNLTIQLRELEHAPRLDQQFNDKEQAVLKMADWAHRWSAGQVPEDLVIELAGTGEEYATALGIELEESERTWIKRLAFKTIVSPTQGAAINIKASDAKGNSLHDVVLLSHRDRLVLGSIVRRQKLDVMHDGKLQCKFSFEVRANDPTRELDNDRPFLLAAGLSGKSFDEPQSNFFRIEMKFLPAALLSLVHDKDLKSELKDGRLEITGPQFHAIVDSATGRPVEIELGDQNPDSHLRVITESSALAAEQRRFEEHLAGGKTYDSTSPWLSTMAFVLDEWILSLQHQATDGDGGSQRKVAACRAISKLMANWHKAIANDRAHDKVVRSEAEREKFSVPGVKSSVAFVDLFGNEPDARRQEVGALLGMLRSSAPKDGCLWLISRSVLLWLVEDETDPTLGQLTGSSDLGPIGHWLLTSLLVENAAEAGLAANTLAGFRTDYRPLLNDDSPLSKLVLSIAEAARSLSKQELRDLAYFAEDQAFRQSLTDALLGLHSDTKRPIAESLADSLDQFWQQHLRERIKFAFQRQILSDDDARTAGGKGAKPAPPAFETPISQQLKGLDDLEQELGNLSKPERLPPLAPADTPTKPD